MATTIQISEDLKQELLKRFEGISDRSMYVAFYYWSHGENLKVPRSVRLSADDAQALSLARWKLVVVAVVCVAGLGWAENKPCEPKNAYTRSPSVTGELDARLPEK